MECPSAARTDVGRVRSKNEDAFLARPDLGVFAIADGMGGHVAGDVASRIAVETVEAALGDVDPDAPADATADRLVDAVRAANRTILERSHEDPEIEGMGTTLTVLAMAASGDAYAIAHVGDSRAYRLRAGAAERLTVDHTWVQQQVDRGLLAPERARTHPFRSVLTRALGTELRVDVDVATDGIESGDLLLICSDGLTAHVADEEFTALFGADRPLDELADRAVREANRRGGTDNITLILVRAGDAGRPAKG